MLCLQAELVIQCSFEKMSMRYGFCSLFQILSCTDLHSFGTSNLGKQIFKTVVSFGVKGQLLVALPNILFLSNSGPQRKGKKERKGKNEKESKKRKEKKSYLGGTCPALALGE